MSSTHAGTRSQKARDPVKELGIVSGHSVVDDMIRCDYYVEAGNRFRSKLANMLVSRHKYVELWRAKLLAWQIENKQLPTHLPHPKEVEASLKAMANV